MNSYPEQFCVASPLRQSSAQAISPQSPSAPRPTSVRFTAWATFLVLLVLLARPAAAQTIDSPAASATLTYNQPTLLTATAPAGSTKVEFYDNAILLGTATKVTDTTWKLYWTPRFHGTRSLTAKAADAGSTVTTSPAVSVTVAPDSGPAGSLLAYVGGTGQQELTDALALSDGTVLLAGSADDLAWTTAPATQLTVAGLASSSTTKTAFLLHLSSDRQTILGLYYLPDGQVENLRWIKTTSKPGAATTGDLYVSGATNATGGYFIAKLNNNFVNGTPTGFAWARTATLSNSYGDNLGLQPWDVGGDGRVVFADEIGTLRVFVASGADGSLLKLADLRGSHWPAAVTLDNTNRQEGIGSTLPSTTISGVSFPADLRSWTDTDRLAILPDGNGSIKRGTWPMDIFYAVRDKTGTTTGDPAQDVYGYTGYKSVGKYRLGAIAVDRDTGAFSIGFNTQSLFYDPAKNGGTGGDQPDFEPAVITYSATGALLWWSRLYHEVVDANDNDQIDSGETRISLPDQYVDGLTFDYSDSAMTKLVVNARCHGNDTSNFWSGNAIAAHPSAQGFANQFTGTEGNIHISWIAKLEAATGTLQAASWLTGFWRKSVTLDQGNYTESIHDNWPSHNLGWPNLTTTKAEPGSLRVDSAGRVAVVGVGPRMVTTTNAYQKLPVKASATRDEGNSPWVSFVRVYEPDLATLAYSTAIAGAWTYDGSGNPIGADNTTLLGCFPLTDTILFVGRHNATSGTATGNPVPVNKVPAWATSAPTDQTALFGQLSYQSPTNQSPIATDDTLAAVSGVAKTLSPLANDLDPENTTLALNAVSTPAHGTTSFVGTTITYTATSGYSGPDTFTYTVADAQGNTATGTVSVTVSARNYDAISLDLGRTSTEDLAPADTAGVVPRTHWNAITGTAASNLLGDDGYVTTAGISTTNANSTYDTALTATTPDQKIMRRHVGSTSSSSTYTLSGIPFASYDVYVYWGGSGYADSVTASFAIGSTTYFIKHTDRLWDGTYTRSLATTAGAAVNEEDYVVFENLTATEFTLTVGNTSRSGPAGIQIVERRPPEITTQPVAQSVQAGQTATFTLAAEGVNLSYQWRKNSVNLTNGGRISGATTATLSIAETALSDADTYDCVVTNPAGSVTSTAVSLTVRSFSHWIATYSAVGSLTAATDDPDHDGLPNLLEYALGTEPDSSASRPTLESQISNSKLQLSFTPQRSELTYSVEASSDLATWTALSMPSLTVGQAATVTDTTALTAGTKRFLRLKVTP